MTDCKDSSFDYLDAQQKFNFAHVHDPFRHLVRNVKKVTEYVNVELKGTLY